ncbi:carbohydrate ABC transporter permease [Allofournierella sp.]|uniref:carbohydrate ABC transporter permease n=1 Tax=Allofournierella sp. TaxID=1940256 RepID=UPI003AB39796
MQKKKQKGLPRLVDPARLTAVLCSAVCFLVPAVFAKLPQAGVQAFHTAGYILWGALAVEAVVCLVRMEKETRRYFLKLHKSDLVFCAATLVCLPLSLAAGMAGLGWVVLLKLPGALLPFNNEKVFQKIVNIAAALMVIVFIFPFFNVLAVSLSAPDQIVNLFPKQIDLYSMKYVLTDSGFFRSMGVSIVVTAVGTALSVISMAMAAYPLSKARMPFRRSMMMFFVIVMLFTGGMAPNMLLMNALHLNNTIWSLIFPSVVQVFYLILLKGFFEDVPEELEESARLDGASNYTILFRIVLPVAAPMVATVAFFTMISYWNNINNAILYITSNQSIYPLPMYIRNFLNRNPMEVAMTNPTLVRYWDNVKMSYVLFSIVPVILVYPFTFKYLKNGVAMGAVKG